MPTRRTVLIAAALTASSFAPTSALAAHADPTPILEGPPQLRILDDHHATLSFDAQRLPRTASGALDAKIAFANHARVSNLHVNKARNPVGRYVATVSSSRVMRNHGKFAVTFRLGASKPVTRMLDGRSLARPELRGSPQMRIVDEHHATLNFASDELQRSKSGKLDAAITFANGERVSGLTRHGSHGYDAVYVATISSPSVMTDHEKFSVAFRLGGSPSVTRTVKLYRVGEHG